MLCAKAIVTVVPKYEVVIAEKAYWIEGHPEVKVTIPEQKQEIIVCKHLEWDELTDTDLWNKAIKAINDHWTANEDASTHQINKKDKNTILGADWENTLKSKTGKVEIEAERDRLKGLIDKEKTTSP